MGVEIEVCISYMLQTYKAKENKTCAPRLMPILTDFKRITIASVE